MWTLCSVSNEDKTARIRIFHSSVRFPDVQKGFGELEQTGFNGKHEQMNDPSFVPPRSHAGNGSLGMLMYLHFLIKSNQKTH